MILDVILARQYVHGPARPTSQAHGAIDGIDQGNLDVAEKPPNTIAKVAAELANPVRNETN